MLVVEGIEARPHTSQPAASLQAVLAASCCTIKLHSSTRERDQCNALVTAVPSCVVWVAA